MGKGVKMATQAKEMRIRRTSLNPHRGLGLDPHSVFEEKFHSGFKDNLRIAIAVKLMVKMKNLFRLKDGLGPCLEDAIIK
jgi:hypothetical protein